MGDAGIDPTGYPVIVTGINREVDMATRNLIYRPRFVCTPFVRKLEEWINNCIPRCCMLFCVGLTLLGLTIPAAMIIHWLPTSLFLAFLSITLITVGPLMTIYKWGTM